MIAAALVFAAFLLSNMPSPIYPLWQNEIGFPTATITVLFSLYQGGVLIGLLGLGRYVDKIGWRTSLIGATLLSCAASVAFAGADTAWQLMLGRFISGMAAGVFVSCGPAAITAVFERAGHRRPSLVASLAISSGLACGPLLGGFFADYAPAPTRFVFIVEALLLAVGAIALLRDNTLRTVGRPNVDASSEAMIANAAEVSRRKFFMVVTFIFTSCYIASGVYMSIGSSYLQSSLGVHSAVLAGLLVFLVFGSAFTAQLMAARFSPLSQAIVALAAGGVGALILVLGISLDSSAALFASAVFSGASQGLGQLVGLTLVRRITALPKLRGAYAILNTVGYAVSGGSIAASWPLVKALGTAGAIVVIAAVVVVLTFTAGALTFVHRERMR
ncbi:MFS transporter [Pseudomonas syringae]|uniref:MFS transporter n=1 Tax=Pseudomonas syringae TaxID=317 RepID=UPI00215AB83D|nr:MFS transporter [Pseudomonas syringae]MCR8720607.1 MFS transporter [Pseudomonas syringae]